MTHDPVLIAYGVHRSRNKKQNIWTRVGKAHPHEVGAGLTIVLDAVPRDGRIILLEPNTADDERLEAEAKRFPSEENVK